MNHPKVSIGYVSTCTLLFTVRSETRRQRKGNKIKIRLVWSDCYKSEIISDEMNLISQTGWWERLSLWHRTSIFSINVISLRYVLSSSSTSLRSGDAVLSHIRDTPSGHPWTSVFGPSPWLLVLVRQHVVKPQLLSADNVILLS